MLYEIIFDVEFARDNAEFDTFESCLEYAIRDIPERATFVRVVDRYYPDTFDALVEFDVADDAIDAFRDWAGLFDDAS